MIVVVPKNATPEEVQAALAKFNIHPRPEKSPIAELFGVLKKSEEDPVTYQRRIREEWS